MRSGGPRARRGSASRLLLRGGRRDARRGGDRARRHRVGHRDAGDANLTDRVRAHLASLGDRARSLDETMGRGSPRNATVSLTAVVADVVDASDCEHPSLDVETDVVDVRVVDDSAEITQPRHGSGLGVWVAKRVRESCGGRLTFEESPLVAVP